MPAFRRDLYVPTEGYDVGDLARRKLLDLLVRRAGLFPGEEALVVECGLGEVATALAGRFTKCDVVATDDRADRLDRARANAKTEEVRDRIRFHHATPAELPFRTERFIVTAYGLDLHLQPDPVDVLAELHRVTDYAGKLLVPLVDFSRARRVPEGAHENAVDEDVQEAMREMGWSKVGLQKVTLLSDGAVLYLVQAKRLDPEDTTPG